MKISVVSGGFDPIHSGHISYLKSAKEISDYLIVALNSDNWLVNKKKRVFMSLEERKNILSNIYYKIITLVYCWIYVVIIFINPVFFHLR